MGHEGKHDQSGAEQRPGRTWTERLGGAVRYRRYSDLDGGGRPSIFFKFELAPGQTELPTAVYETLQGLKWLDRSSGHGGGQFFTGLAFQRSRKHGRVWKLPDDPTGRTVADMLDARLFELAHRIDPPSGRGF